MIKNVIFDLGNVIFKLKFKDIIKRFTEDEKEERLLENVIFNSEQWLQLDDGVISKENAINIMLSKLPFNLHEICKKIMEDWTFLGLELNDQMIDFVKKIRDRGYNTYILSNAPLEIPNYLKKLHLIEYFDGKIISAEEKLSKPNLEIYKLLLNKFNLNSEESLFIDDKLENIKAAEECGINGYVFDYNKFDEFLEDMKKYNICLEE